MRAATLKNGDTRSCGCVKSHGEKQIAELLNQMKVDFAREYSFADCVNSKGNRLKFDFAIFSKKSLLGLIEFQGEQHYVVPARNPQFGAMQRNETDQLKKDYCLMHNIPLYEIKYDEDICSRITTILHALQDNTVPSPDDNSGKV